MFMYTYMLWCVCGYTDIICFKELSYTIVGAGSFSPQAECLLLFICSCAGSSSLHKAFL